ncbi:conserved protein of unknown function [Candidatus Hydrogenisulfobacillus filiaventi]|uniref:Uncharacterized protein n=1 Tax=Candidatus Hydrogenisulfobacillus filiaventi TaxID=2707344 RepID=A0A6F8ZI29_9FIRM|nr:hypothetical protein [Bacillota bacterium]CAB1129602.1 conserved protein of unknown function [Candidatus Hydrogenisulfobacillus filiaventi]
MAPTIKTFRIHGHDPNFQVSAVLNPGGEDPQDLVVELGPWDYVSTLSESQLRTLIRTKLAESRGPVFTAAMRNLSGQALD